MHQVGNLCVTFYRLEAIGRSTAAQAFSGEGAAQYAGRWHSRATRVVYTSSSAALACLETLVHMQTVTHPTERWLFAIDVPDEFVQPLGELPRHWDAEQATAASQTVGDHWIAKHRSVALLVPSTIVPMEMNALINPRHPNFRLEWVKLPMRFRYDPRLK